MPLLMNFTTPSPIQEFEEPVFDYNDGEQISYEMRTIGTRCLRSSTTRVKTSGNGVCSKSDKKNEIDDSKSVK